MASDKDLYEARQRGLTDQQIAEQFRKRDGNPLSVTSISARIRRYKGTLKPSIAAKVVAHIAPAPKRPDEEKWQDAQSDLMRRGHITVVHLSDGHRPYQDDDALELAYQVVEYLQPDLIVDLSDGFDFPTISRFAQDPDIPNSDIIETVQPHWNQHHDRLDTMVPKAYRRAIMGNHDQRFQAFLAEVAPQIRTTALAAFDTLVRAHDRVIFPDYLGEIHLGALTVMHGDKSTLGMYGPKRQLEARKYQRFVMAGHSHHPGYYLARGPEYTVASVIGGCLCLPAHYIKGTTYNTWTQGFAYAVYDVKARYAWLHNVVFERESGLLKTSIGNRIFAQEVEAQAAQERTA